MTSALPPALEANQIRIKKISKALQQSILVAAIGGLYLIAKLRNYFHYGGDSRLDICLLLVLYCVAMATAYKYREKLCRKINFVCPHCHKTLYDGTSKILVTGCCPNCKEPLT